MRLFVAFLLSDEARALLRTLRAGLSRFDADVRWTVPEQWHVTVKFLGDMPDRDVSVVGEALVEGAKEASPFRMTVGGTGCFPPRGPVRIVWAGAADESGGMDNAVKSIQVPLEACGFPPENRPWTGHITVGRVQQDRSGDRLRDAVAALPMGTVAQDIDSVTLMASALSPRGATYSKVQTVTLG